MLFIRSDADCSPGFGAGGSLCSPLVARGRHSSQVRLCEKEAQALPRTISQHRVGEDVSLQIIALLELIESSLRPLLLRPLWGHNVLCAGDSGLCLAWPNPSGEMR